MLLTILQIIVTVLLIGTIILQMQSSGLGGGMGGDMYRSKRSFEKFLLWSTGVLAACFAIISILLLISR